MNEKRYQTEIQSKQTKKTTNVINIQQVQSEEVARIETPPDALVSTVQKNSIKICANHSLKSLKLPVCITKAFHASCVKQVCNRSL